MQGTPKISIITVVFNGRDTIRDCINSVLNQSYENMEYIIVDGGSKDGTTEIIESYQDRISAYVSEPDDGIYDAMNKGVKMATGDIIGILNADDFYSDDDVISDVVNELETKKVDSVFADLVYIKNNDYNKVVRYYSSSNFNPGKFSYGWMPAHPTFFARKELYEKFGLFKTDYLIASDYELLVRFIARYKISYSYIPRVLVRMRTGGLSTRNFKSNWILNKEIVRACAENGIRTNIFKVLSKYTTKVFQLIPQIGYLSKF